MERVYNTSDFDKRVKIDFQSTNGKPLGNI